MWPQEAHVWFFSFFWNALSIWLAPARPSSLCLKAHFLSDASSGYTTAPPHPLFPISTILTPRIFLLSMSSSLTWYTHAFTILWVGFHSKVYIAIKSVTWLKRHAFKQDIRMANNHMKRCSTSLIIREMQIKTTVRLSPQTGQNGHHQKSTNKKFWREYEEKETILHYLWEGKSLQPIWGTVWSYLKRLKTEPPYDPAVPYLGIYSEKTVIQECTNVHCNTIYNSQDVEAT